MRDARASGWTGSFFRPSRRTTRRSADGSRIRLPTSTSRLVAVLDEEATGSFSTARLALARRRKGLRQRALAETSGIAERTLVAYEHGSRAPSNEALAVLSRVLGFAPAFFSRDEPESIASDQVSFRAMTRMKASQREAALA